MGNDPVNRSDPSGLCAKRDKKTLACLDSIGGIGETAAASSSLLEDTDSSGNQQTATAASTTWTGPADGSGYSNNPTNLPLEAQKKNFADPKQNGMAESKKQEAIGMALIPAAGITAGLTIETAPVIGRLFFRCCFAAGTLVDTDRGLRSIEQIKVGDRVLSREEATGATAYKPVLALIRPHHRQIFRLTLEVGERGERHRIEFGVSDDHPWRTVAGQWVETTALTPGDRLIRARGPPARVISVEGTARSEATFNLEVADFHTYFVGRDRLWVHNACSVEKLAEAALKYPGKAGRLKFHHILPRYLGGAANSTTVRIDAAYHQLITNGFRSLAPYGGSLPQAERILEIMKEVYGAFPLP